MWAGLMCRRRLGARYSSQHGSNNRHDGRGTLRGKRWAAAFVSRSSSGMIEPPPIKLVSTAAEALLSSLLRTCSNCMPITTRRDVLTCHWWLE